MQHLTRKVGGDEMHTAEQQEAILDLVDQCLLVAKARTEGREPSKGATDRVFDMYQDCLYLKIPEPILLEALEQTFPDYYWFDFKPKEEQIESA